MRRSKVLMMSAMTGALMAGGLMTTGVAQAATPAPSLTGIWLLDQSIFDGGEVDPTVKRGPRKVPMRPEIKAMADAQTKERLEKGQVLGGGQGGRCGIGGMPGMVTNEFAMEFLETPGRITVINETSSLTRTISLTRKTHNTDQDPGYAGDSIGHWEGKTLVVETTNLNDASSHIPGVPNVKQGTVKITERYHLEKGGDLLVNDMTFENPAVLSEPYTIQYAYHRAPPESELWEYVCQVDAPGWSERFAGDPQFKGNQKKP